MALCSRCGVMLETGVSRCPLCGTTVGSASARRQVAASAPNDIEPQGSAVRVWLWEVLTLLAGTVAAVVVGVDLAFGLRLTWSLYVLSALVAFWLASVAVLLLVARPLAMLAALTVICTVLLYVLEQYPTGKQYYPVWLPEVEAGFLR